MSSQCEDKGGRTRRSDVEAQKYLLLREEVWSGDILKARIKKGRVKGGREWKKEGSKEKRKEEQECLLEVNSKFCLRYSVETACKNIASTYLNLFHLSNNQRKIPLKFLITCDCSDCCLLWSIKVPSKGKILSSPKCAIQLWEATAIYFTLKRLMSYIYGAPFLDVPRSHTTTQHSR